MICAVCKKEIKEKYYAEVSWNIVKTDSSYQLPVSMKKSVFDLVNEKLVVHTDCLVLLIKRIKEEVDGLG